MGWIMLTVVLVVIVAAILGLHHLGRVQPQKLIELPVIPPHQNAKTG